MRGYRFASRLRVINMWGLMLSVSVILWELADMVRADDAPTAGDSPAPLRWETDGAPLWTASPHVPLAGCVKAVTSTPCKLTVKVDDGASPRELTSPGEATREHSLPVLELKPGRQYTLSVTAHGEGTTLSAEPIRITMPPLPADFPSVSLITADADRMEPGLTLCTILRWEDNAASLDAGWFAAFDAQGEVVWYCRLPEPAGSIRPLPGGGFGFLHGARPTGLREIDPLGNPLRQFRTTGLGIPAEPGEIAVEADTFHHDLVFMPNGNRLVLSTEVRTVENFPSSPADLKSKGKANVVGDVVLELQADGSIAGRWALLDILDPTRIGYGSFDRFWDLRAYPFYFDGTRDWGHCNCVTYDAEDDALIVCLRHQDAVVKFDRKTSEVQWILGDPLGWKGALAEKVLKPVGKLEWPFHAHGVKFRSADGRLLLFDNGNHRALPPRKPIPASASFSRAVEYEIDEDARTIREVWSYGDRRRNRFFSAFVGDADWLPQTGNVLITDGGRLEDARGVPVGDPPGAVQWGRVIEVTRDDAADVVFELHVSEKGRGNRFGSSIYRAERIPSLSP